MSSLRPGQDIVLSWSSGATDCRVVAAAGAFVLLRPERTQDLADALPGGRCTLTFLDGMIPMGWDGSIEFGSEPGELRFRFGEADRGADRRSSVRLPIFCTITVTAGTEQLTAQMLDVSAGGMRFRGAGPHAVGSAVHIRADLPSGPAVDADAVVRLSEPGGVVAVEYTALHGATAHDIGAWTVAQLRSSLTPA
jgi:hypothetical protein